MALMRSIPRLQGWILTLFLAATMACGLFVISKTYGNGQKMPIPERGAIAKQISKTYGHGEKLSFPDKGPIAKPMHHTIPHQVTHVRPYAKESQDDSLNVSIALKQAKLSYDGEFVDVLYEPPAGINTIPSPSRALHVPAWIYREVIAPPAYVTLDERSARESFVFVTGADTNYYHKVMAAIQTVQEHYPSQGIVFYDLGLTSQQVATIKTVCGLEYKLFNFTLYPAHVKVLKYYAWKPLIIYHELRKHAGVFWIDASIRFKPSSESDITFREVVNNGGGLFMRRGRFLTVVVTHGNMFEYIPTDMTAFETRQQRAANCVLYYRTKHIYENVIMWMTFCALDKQCIASSDSRICHNEEVIPHAVYSQGCHRYDQSLVNILMANSYGFDHAITTSKSKILDIHRYKEKDREDRVRFC